MLVRCEWCNKPETVIPSRAAKYRFCSYVCRGAWRKVNWSGPNNPAWQGGKREKVCLNCSQTYRIKSNQPITTFRKQKFCSPKCGFQGRPSTAGSNNPRWKGGKSKRSNRQHKWATAVISRDMAICQHCGTAGVELHAHHIKSFNEYPELRWDINNGLTLCCHCHWAVHSAGNANAVNSGKPLTDHAEGNPEPSPSGNIREGVTTRGRAYRRWEGHCANCGKFLSKRLSDVKGKSFIACSCKCAGTYQWIRRRSMAVMPP